ncbi:MAG TPA: hypothetical protein QF804_08390, partial [Rhodospirillales bacterium]|nr:hypothetical protein [Rhodospirillales bacterium]
MEDDADRCQRRRIARQLEQPKQAEHAHEPEIERHEDAQIERQDRDQVDQRHRRQRVADSLGRRTAVSGGPVL